MISDKQGVKMFIISSPGKHYTYWNEIKKKMVSIKTGYHFGISSIMTDTVLRLMANIKDKR